MYIVLQSSLQINFLRLHPTQNSDHPLSSCGSMGGSLMGSHIREPLQENLWRQCVCVNFTWCFHNCIITAVSYNGPSYPHCLRIRHLRPTRSVHKLHKCPLSAGSILQLLPSRLCDFMDTFVLSTIVAQHVQVLATLDRPL